MPYPMTAARRKIKMHLALGQTYGGRVRCALCGDSDANLGREGDGSDLHELFLEKDDVQGAPEAVYAAIHETELNLLVLCNTCNMTHAKYKTWREFLFRKKLDQIGARAKAVTHADALKLGAQIVTEWITGLGLKNAEPYILRVQAAAELPAPVRGLED